MGSNLKKAIPVVVDLVRAGGKTVGEAIRESWPTVKRCLGSDDIRELAMEALGSHVNNALHANSRSEVSVFVEVRPEIETVISVRLVTELLNYEAASGERKALVRFTVEDWQHFITRATAMRRGLDVRIGLARASMEALQRNGAATMEELAEDERLRLDALWADVVGQGDTATQRAEQQKELAL